VLNDIKPENAVFVLVSFEGPDRYSLAGGLGVRMSELSRSLAETGYETHLIFVGDPSLPGKTTELGGKLTLYRWSQWVSQYYPGGVYDGENEKLYDFDESVPGFVVEQIVWPAIAGNKLVVIMGEDWHTANTLPNISDILYQRGMRDNVLMLWNANNPMGFEKINWGRLGYVSTITTVSRFMKHYMWSLGINPLVIPNGIPQRLFSYQTENKADMVRERIGGDYFMFKIGRWDPDKRWNMAIEAAAQLKSMGLKPRMLIRGGAEPYEGEVLHNANRLGLNVAEVRPADNKLENILDVIDSVSEADVLNLKFFVPDDLLAIFYRAADAVLANSGMEPFGLVGLEAMAAGAVVFTGSTGEDYAQPFKNALVLETDNPAEITSYLRSLDVGQIKKIRENARWTAAEFTWDKVNEIFLTRLNFLAYTSLPSEVLAKTNEGVRINYV